MKFYQRTLVFLLSVFALSSQSALSNSSKKLDTNNEKYSFSEYQAVIEALQPYIQNAKTGNGKKIRTPFYEHAHIVGSINGKFINADLDAFENNVNSAGPAPSVQHQIVWVDISGPAAAAKVEFINWGGLRFTDFFVLYKHNGQWKISGKVYDSHSNN